MSDESNVGPRATSKAAITVDVQNDNHAIYGSILDICGKAEAILESQAPTKKQRKCLLDTAASLLQLQTSVAEKIPELLPSNCSVYSLMRLHSVDAHTKKTCVNEVSPSFPNLRKRGFEVSGAFVPLPENRKLYTAQEACAVLVDIEQMKKPSLNKVVDPMLSYNTSPSTTPEPLIPCGRSAMFRVLKKYRENNNVDWAVRGQPPILPTSTFVTSIHNFEKDEGRAVSKPDLKNLLKSAKEDVAKLKGNSTLLLHSPSKRTVNNYLGLLPQLEPNRSKTKKVQQKSEARYIAERSLRNAISHILAVSVAHYQIGKPDTRFKSIDKATEGAKKLYELVKKENEGLEMRVILPMFISTTDNTTMFAFEGSVDSKADECYIVKKDNDSGTQSAYTQTSSSTDSCRGIRIRHTVSFNGVGNAAPFYMTIYGLSDSELPKETCPSGVYHMMLPGFSYGANRNCSNSTVGHIVFIRSTSKEDDISTDQLNHELYRKQVFLPWVEETRENYLRLEGWKGGDDVDDDNIWVGWQVRN